jgi:hypothetical protein
MFKRIFTGLFKGIVIGGGVAAGLQFGLGWATASGLLGYLLAMGIGGTTATLSGRPPWKSGAWVEALLKGFFGVALGALGYWVATTWLPFALPFALGPSLAGAEWTSVPLAYLTVISSLVGILIDLDNTGGGEEDGGKGRKGPRVRVGAEEAIEEAVLVGGARKRQR